MVDRTKPWYMRRIGGRRVVFILALAFWVERIVDRLPQFNRIDGLIAAIVTLTVLVWLATEVD